MNKNQYLCSCCREPKTISYFYSGVGIQNDKNLPICKECCKQKLDKYTAIIGAEAGAWVLMAELGIPFIRDKWKGCLVTVKTNVSKNKGNSDPIAYYIKGLKEDGIIYQGFWESDTMLDEILGDDEKRRKVDVTNLEDMRKRWGNYEDTTAYEFLEQTFLDYTEELVEMDANLINRYKDLCAAEYAKRKAQEAGDILEISKAQDNLAKQLKLLKLDDFQQSSKSDEEKRIERKAWMIENIRPAECEDLDKYKDFSKIGKTWEDIKRCVVNLVGGTKEYPEIPRNVM